MAGTLRRRGIIAEINVTPLVDIMLVLLIIFMLTAHLIARQAIQVDLPHTSQSTTAKPTLLSVTMTDDGRISLNNQFVTADGLRAAVAAAVAKDPNVPLLVAAGKSVSHGRIMWLLDTVSVLGVSELDFQVDRSIAVPPKEP